MSNTTGIISIQNDVSLWDLQETDIRYVMARASLIQLNRV